MVHWQHGLASTFCQPPLGPRRDGGRRRPGPSRRLPLAARAEEHERRAGRRSVADERSDVRGDGAPPGSDERHAGGAAPGSEGGELDREPDRGSRAVGRARARLPVAGVRTRGGEPRRRSCGCDELGRARRCGASAARTDLRPRACRGSRSTACGDARRRRLARARASRARPADSPGALADAARDRRRERGRRPSARRQPLHALPRRHRAAVLARAVGSVRRLRAARPLRAARGRGERRRDGVDPRLPQGQRRGCGE